MRKRIGGIALTLAVWVAILCALIGSALAAPVPSTAAASLALPLTPLS